LRYSHFFAFPGIHPSRSQQGIRSKYEKQKKHCCKKVKIKIKNSENIVAGRCCRFELRPAFPLIAAFVTTFINPNAHLRDPF
jgi:hypothetical protein